jgi:membrane protein DedA with SNARE-associated domain
MIPKLKEKNQFPKYLALIGVAAQMGVTIYLGSYFGKKLDEKYPNEKNYFTIGLTLLSVFVAMFVIVKQLNQITKE